MCNWFWKLIGFKENKSIEYSDNETKIMGWMAVRYDDAVTSCATSRIYLLGKPDTFVPWENRGWTWQKVEVSIKKIKK